MIRRLLARLFPPHCICGTPVARRGAYCSGVCRKASEEANGYVAGIRVD